jgi:hypothetical protein
MEIEDEGKMIASSQTELHEAGGVTGAGAFICLSCGGSISFDAPNELPACPECGGARYRRASLFEPPTAERPAVEFTAVEPEWLPRARSAAARGGIYLAFEEAGRIRLQSLIPGWTRVGRGIAADLRLDDPTVSRRHAQVVRTADDRTRVIDDRSLNGVFVNGRLVEWSALSDSDELTIGRYRLRLIDAVRDRDAGSQ